ncbi:HD-GYP domain-containing protein [Rhizobium sp.]
MLKRIHKNQVRNGMFIEDFVGEAQDNPISRRRFIIRDADEIAQLKSSAISGVIINTALGVDIGETSSFAKDRAKSRSAVLAAANNPLERLRTIHNLRESVDSLRGVFSSAAQGPSAKAMAPLADQVTQTMKDNPLVLLNITRLKSKDEVTFLHSIAVSALMVRLATHLEFDAATVQLIGMAGLLHDIGKTQIPDAVLNKDGKLAEAELALIRKHPEFGHEILLREADMPQMVLDVCRHHHERLDGKGYPDGLAAAEIDVYVRICTICDVYDAITSARPYKRPWTHRDAVDFMMEQQGAFDRELLHEFFSSMELIVDTRRRRAS